MEPLRTLKVGLDSLLLEFGSGGEVVEAFRSARSRRDEGLLEAIEIIPAARTLLLSGVEVDRVLGDLEHWGAGAGEQQQPELIELPIRYDGPDIESVARLWIALPKKPPAFTHPWNIRSTSVGLPLGLPIAQACPRDMKCHA
ncbi:MAG: carboxyltransferase domain-containing protein [Marmoricola sp.]